MSRETVSECHIAETPQDSPWRVGRKVGRTIYVLIGGEPSDEDELIGVMDSMAVAAAAVDGHNATLSPWSKCCGFPVTVGGGDPDEGTAYHICSACEEPCDAVYAEVTGVCGATLLLDPREDVSSVTPDLTIDPPREDHVEWVELSAKAEQMQAEQELRERMELIERFARSYAEVGCENCEGDGIEKDGGEWTLCECCKDNLEAAEAIAEVIREGALRHKPDDAD